MFELVFTTKRGSYWQTGGEGNRDIVAGTGLVTYLLRCKGTTYKTGQPTAEKLVQRLDEASEYLADKAHFEAKVRENQRRRELRLVGGEG